MALTADTVFRDFVTDGVPASGKNQPKKAEVRELLTGYETIINAFTSNGGMIVNSYTSLQTLLNYPSLTMAWVVTDPNPNLNGIYQKQGASGTGSWVRMADLPYSFIKASNSGAGTPNAILATSSIPVPAGDGVALIVVNITHENDGPATIAFNGTTALAIKASSGIDVPAGGLVPGMMMAGFKSAGTFRLITEVVSEATAAAAAAAAAAAIAAKDEVEGILGGLSATAVLNRYHAVADLKTTNTPAQNSALLDAVVAQAIIDHGADARVAVTPGALSSTPSVGGIRELVGLGSGELDFSGRGSGFGSLISAAGSLTVDTYALNQDAVAGSTSLRFSDAVAATMGLAAGKWLLLQREAGEVNTSAGWTLGKMGEYVQVDKGASIISAGGNTTVYLNRPLRMSYPVTDSARVKIPSLIPPFAYRNIVLLGTGQQHVPAAPANGDGDNGALIMYCERAEYDNVRVFNSERNALRSYGNIETEIENSSAEFSRAKTNAQIQYGISIYGPQRRASVRGFRQLRGRHGIDAAANEGFVEELSEIGCRIDGAYAAAYTEHDGLISRVSSDCAAYRCGAGFDYRGGAGSAYTDGRRINTRPVVTTQLQLAEDGATTLIAQDAAFILRDCAGNLTVSGMDVRDVGYVMRAQHEGTNLYFGYPGFAPKNIRFEGGAVQQVTRGFFVDHSGGIAHGATYNTTETGPYEFEGVSLFMSGRPSSPANSVRSFSFEGYVGRASIKDCEVEYATGVDAYYSLLANGCDDVYVAGGRWKRSLGSLISSKGVLNSSGGAATRNPNRLTFGDAPSLDATGSLVTLSTRPAMLRMPPPITDTVQSAAISGTTAKTSLGRVRLPTAGTTGVIEIDASWLNGGTANKTFSIELNGTQIDTVTSSNGAVRRAVAVFCQGSSSTKRVVSLGANTAGSASTMATASINTASTVDVEFFVQMSSSAGGETAQLVGGNVKVSMAG